MHSGDLCIHSTDFRSRAHIAKQTKMARKQDLQEAVPRKDSESTIEKWEAYPDGLCRQSGASLDIKIDIERGLQWKGRNQRIESLKTRSIPNSEPRDPNPSLDKNPSRSSNEELTQPNLIVEDHGADNFMDLELFWAATKYDVDGFINVLERVSTEKELSLPAILDSVSPLGNTLLHVAASYGNEETVGLIAYYSPSILTKKNSKGDTALHVAVKGGYLFVVQALVSLQRDFASSSSDGVTVREVALNDMLLRATNDEGNTALHEALINRLEWVAIELIGAEPELIYYLNKEEKSALYLAAEAGYEDCLRNMLEDPARNGNAYERLKAKSPIHAAVMGRNIDVLDIILEKEPRSIHLRDEEGRTPLHIASSIGHLEGVRYLLGKYIHGAVERDKNGFLPIHMAAIKGHIHVIQELLQHCPDPRELLNCDDQNILHVAAKSGRHNVVSYIMKTPELEKLINKRDKDGNTPLHLATIHWHPEIVSSLTWDERVDLKLTNEEDLTALDAARYYMDRMTSFRQWLTWAALKAARAPGAPSRKVFNANRETAMHLEPPNLDDYKDRVNTLLLVSTLVATVTFAAGFTMPGGYNNSDPDQGMATMLRYQKFCIFVFFDTIAMYSSIIVAITLIWAQLGDLNLVLTALRLALPMLGIALTSMSLAFMAGVYVVVSKLSWLANAVPIMGLVFLVSLPVLFLPLCFPVSSSYRILR